MKIRLLDFHCLGLLFLLYFINSRVLCPKGLNVLYLSEITMTTLAFRDRSADITYCANVMLFLHAASSGLSVTVTFFTGPISCLNAIFGSFSRRKTACSPNIIPPKQDLIDAEMDRKKKCFLT